MSKLLEDCQLHQGRLRTEAVLQQVSHERVQPDVGRGQFVAGVRRRLVGQLRHLADPIDEVAHRLFDAGVDGGHGAFLVESVLEELDQLGRQVERQPGVSVGVS